MLDYLAQCLIVISEKDIRQQHEKDGCFLHHVVSSSPET